MNRAAILPLAVLFATSCAMAQDSHTSLTLARPQRIDPAQCPVGLDARHGSGLPLLSMADRQGPGINAPAQQGQGVFQRLQLTFTNTSSREIVSAQMTVHGWSKKDRAIELLDASNAPDLVRTIEIAMDVKGKGQASKDVSLSQFTAVTSIDLKSVTYADGSSWHASSAGACSVTPDSLMLVAASPAQ